MERTVWKGCESDFPGTATISNNLPFIIKLILYMYTFYLFNKNYNIYTYIFFNF